MKTFKIVCFCFLIPLIFPGCTKNKRINIHSENDSLLEEISPTFIPRNSEIRIVFTKETECNPEEAMHFNPKEKGSWTVNADKKTFVFKPEKTFRQNEEFTLNVDCNKLFGGKETGFFSHSFVTDKGSYKIHLGEMILDEETNSFTMNGSIKSDIELPFAKAKKLSWQNTAEKKIKLNGMAQKIFR